MGNADCGCCGRRRYSSSDNIDRSTYQSVEKTLPEKERIRKRKNGATIVLSPSSGNDTPRSTSKKKKTNPIQSTSKKKKTNSLQSTRKKKNTNSTQSTSEKKRTEPTQKKTNVPQKKKKKIQQQITQPKKKSTTGGFDFPYGYGDAIQLPIGKNKKEWKEWIRWITDDVAKSFRS